ncbi:uncharacterized protein LOC123775647 [Ursus americanus]|uniref:uncharacterized protein LOC123775647 n=1 Tax=Ursus americanus TaxID=9643 RepID=UPI001E67C66C|nr:uncharacterized protein LOC123775647 [Ursus americanus]
MHSEEEKEEEEDLRPEKNLEASETQSCHRKVGLLAGVCVEGEWEGSLASSPVLSSRLSNSGVRLHAERGFECIHSLKASLQTHPDEDQRLRASGLSAITEDTELEPAPGAFRPLPFCPLLREAGTPFPSQQGPQDPDSAAGEAIPPVLDRAGSRAGAAPALSAEAKTTTRGGRRARDEAGWRAQVRGTPARPPKPGVAAQVCEVPRGSARGRPGVGAGAGREPAARQGLQRVGPAPQGCGSGPRVGCVAGESGLVAWDAR